MTSKVKQTFVVEPAEKKQAGEIFELINSYEGEALLLPRTLESIRSDIYSFSVAKEKGKVIGCVALKPWDVNTAEVRSLVVHKDCVGKCIGRALVESCLVKAKALDLKNVFTLTNIDVFFEKLGFKQVEKDRFEDKVWTDCLSCPRIDSCDETAMLKEIK